MIGLETINALRELFTTRNLAYFDVILDMLTSGHVQNVYGPFWNEFLRRVPNGTLEDQTAAWDGLMRLHQVVKSQRSK